MGIQNYWEYFFLIILTGVMATSLYFIVLSIYQNALFPVWEFLYSICRKIFWDIDITLECLLSQYSNRICLYQSVCSEVQSSMTTTVYELSTIRFCFMGSSVVTGQYSLLFPYSWIQEAFWFCYAHVLTVICPCSRPHWNWALVNTVMIPSGFITGREFLDQQIDYWHLKKHCAPWR